MKILELIQKLLQVYDTPEKKDDFQRTWQHAKDAHQNVQSVIRFVDTKSSVLVAIQAVLTAAIVSFPFIILRLSNEGKETLIAAIQDHAWITCWGPLIWLLTLILGIASLICSLLSVIARKPNYITPFGNRNASELAEGIPDQVVLFPVGGKDKVKETAEAVYQLSNGISDSRIIREYERQLLILGAILESKIRWHRRAVGLLIFHIILSGVLAAICGVLFFPSV
jgi:hypothetical protein